MNDILVYLFLISLGPPQHVGTFSDMNACQEAAKQSAPTAIKSEVGNPPGWTLLCVYANDQHTTHPPRLPPRN